MLQQANGFPGSLLNAILELSNDPEEAVRGAVAEFLKTLVENRLPLLSIPQLELLLFTVFGKQLDYSPAVRQAFLQVLHSLDPAFLPLASSFWFDLEGSYPPAATYPPSHWQTDLGKHLNEVL